MDLTIDPYADGDAPAVADLFDAQQEHLGASMRFQVSDIRESLLEVRDAATDTRVVRAPDGSVVGFAAVWPPPEGGRRAAAEWGCVAARWCGRGIGRDLMAWQLARLGELQRATAPETDWVVGMVADVKDTNALRLFARFGLAPARYWLHMEAPTAGAPPVDSALPAGIRIVDASSADRRAQHAADMDAFADHYGFEYQGYQEWAPGLVESATYRPDLSRIAYAGDDIAAFVLAFDDAFPDRVYIGSVGTLRPWRKRGLASALLTEVLAAGAADGKTKAVLGVDADSAVGAVGLYERAGFSVQDRNVSYEKALPAQR